VDVERPHDPELRYLDAFVHEANVVRRDATLLLSQEEEGPFCAIYKASGVNVSKSVGPLMHGRASAGTWEDILRDALAVGCLFQTNEPPPFGFLLEQEIFQIRPFHLRKIKKEERKRNKALREELVGGYSRRCTCNIVYGGHHPSPR